MCAQGLAAQAHVQGGCWMTLMWLLLWLLLLSPARPPCLSAAFVIPECTEVRMHGSPRPLRQRRSQISCSRRWGGRRGGRGSRCATCRYRSHSCRHTLQGACRGGEGFDESGYTGRLCLCSAAVVRLGNTLEVSGTGSSDRTGGAT